MSVPVCYMCNECRYFRYLADGRPVCTKDRHIIKNHVYGRLACSEPLEVNDDDGSADMQT